MQYKRQWPRWTPPDEMLVRQPELGPYSIANGGMAPGLNNQLGARALYIFQNGEDTLYRIHGSPEWRSIGKSVSSGCVRMINQDVVDLYGRVPDKAPVVVTSLPLLSAVLGSGAIVKMQNFCWITALSRRESEIVFAILHLPKASCGYGDS